MKMLRKCIENWLEHNLVDSRVEIQSAFYVIFCCCCSCFLGGFFVGSAAFFYFYKKNRTKKISSCIYLRKWNWKQLQKVNSLIGKRNQLHPRTISSCLEMGAKQSFPRSSSIKHSVLPNWIFLPKIFQVFGSYLKNGVFSSLIIWKHWSIDRNDDCHGKLFCQASAFFSTHIALKALLTSTFRLLCKSR